jgi:hypothetical protein
VLCIRGILGKGTLRTYPFSRIPTHPFRVLCLVAHGNILGEFLFALVIRQIFHARVPGDVIHFLCHLVSHPEKIAFLLIVIVAV